MTDCRILYCIVTKQGIQGSISFIYYPEFDHFRIGYALKRSAWGKGLVTLCVNKALAHFFDNFGVHRIETYVFPENTASIRVLEKNGFKVLDRIMNARSYRWEDTDEFPDTTVIVDTKCKYYALNKTEYKFI